MRSVAQSLRQLCRFTQHHAERHSPANQIDQAAECFNHVQFNNSFTEHVMS